MQLPEHGANPQNLYAKLGMERPERLLDFSENVNPAGPPESVLEIWGSLVEKLQAYPDPEGEPFFSAAAKFHNVQKDTIFVGNGAAELLSLLAERYRGKKAIVVHPTFSEYETTLKAKGVEITRVFSNAKDGFTLPVDDIKKVMKTAAVLYLCTPNNPTGILPDRTELHDIIRYGLEVGCDVVLDEAFIDFVDESLSFISELNKYPHVSVVRSMTKMYAIPGIRLGYIVANPIVIEEIKTIAPHWNVNGIAAHIGSLCLQEEAYRRQAIEHCEREREKLQLFLKTHDCFVTDSVGNFLSFKLGEVRESRKLYRDLLSRGIVLRHTENFRGMDGCWLRVGMKSEAQMNVLKEELARWFAEN